MTFISVPSGQISSDNSTTSTLSGGASYTGTGEDVKLYSSLTLQIFSDKDSADLGVSVQFSQDNSNWDIKLTSTYRASTQFSTSYPINGRYYRVVYTNGGTAQGSFRLQTLLHANFAPREVNASISLSEPIRDSFGRMRISDPYTLADLSHTTGKRPYAFFEKTSGTGSSTYEANQSAVDMSVSSNGDEIIRESRRYFIYQPGKSLMIMMTGVLNSNTNGSDCRSRIGYFDDENGYYFQHLNGALTLVERSNVTGSVTDTSVAQANWNMDPVDGTTVSGYNINAARTQIFVFDLEWLGVGRVRCGIVYRGTIIYVHEFNHENINTTTYITSGNLPVRYEITSTDIGGPAGTLKQICSTVISEGGYEPTIMLLSASNGTTNKSVTSTETPLIGLRLKSDRRANVVPTNFNAMSTSNANLCLRVRWYPSPSGDPLTGGTWTSVDDESAVQYNSACTGIDDSGSVVVTTFYLSNNTDVSIQNVVGFRSHTGVLFANVTGNANYLTLTAQRIGSGTENVFGAINWKEIE